MRTLKTSPKAEYNRKYYWENRDRLIKSNRVKYKPYRDKRRKWLDDQKNKPCADCGILYHPCVMDFDHVRGEKLFNVGILIASSMEKLEAEIAKCEVVCSNCHRLRTYKRSHPDPKEAFIIKK